MKMPESSRINPVEQPQQDEVPKRQNFEDVLAHSKFGLYILHFVHDVDKVSLN